MGCSLSPCYPAFLIYRNDAILVSGSTRRVSMSFLRSLEVIEPFQDDC